jgi:hypothetical protein
MGSLRDELLIPFRGIGGVGRSLVAGSGVLCRCGWRQARRGMSAAWVRATAGDAAADRLESLFVAGFTGAVGGVVVVLAGRQLAPLAAPFVVPIGWSAATVWVLAAWAVAPAPAPRKKIISDGGVAAPPEPAEPLDAWTVARVIHQIAAANGWLGAHLDDVLAHLPGRSKTELLTVLADAQIPVAEQLKLTLPGGRQRNRQGVRLSTLPPGLGEAPPAPAPGLPQPAPTHPPESPPRAPQVTVHGA